MLFRSGVTQIVAARLEPTDVHEDEAAERIAAPLAGDGVRANAAFTGRVNLYAARAGLLLIDADRVNGLNTTHEAITLATLAPWTWVDERQLLATVKIIPFSAPAAAVDAAERIAAMAPLEVSPTVLGKVGLIQTELPSTRKSVLDKTEIGRAHG